jgi:lipid-A-disaccharide synthase-like uncharacterized protein
MSHAAAVRLCGALAVAFFDARFFFFWFVATRFLAISIPRKWVTMPILGQAIQTVQGE